MYLPTRRGFSLIELLFTLTTAAILSTLAMPGLQHLVVRNQVSQAHNQLIAALQLARSEAITHNTASILCPTADGHTCAPAQQWAGGWLTGVDQDRDYQPDDQPSRVFTGFANGIRVYSSRGRLQVRFQSDGSSPGSNLSLIVCQTGQPQTARSIVVSNFGRVRQGQPSPEQARACSQSQD